MKEIKKITFLFVLAIFTFLVSTSSVFAEEYGTLFKKVTTDGTLTLNASDPEDIFKVGNMVTASIINDLNDSSIEVYAGPHCEGPEDCLTDKDSDGYYTISAQIGTEEDAEVHLLRVKFNESDVISSVKTSVASITDKLSFGEFEVTDLGFVNFIYSIKKGNNETDFINNSLLYSNDIIKEIGNKNIKYVFLPGMGGSAIFGTSAAGELTISYDGVLYDVAEMVTSQLKNVIYVPDDTADTDDAYISAAIKRINDYLGIESGITIEPYKTASDVITNGDSAIDEYGEFEYIMDNYYSDINHKMIYKISVNGNTFYTFIEKDSSKMQTPLFNVEDPNTNISISSSNGSVPLDTNFSATYIEKGTDEYNTIDKIIDGEFSAINLELYSNVKSSYITKLDNGKFLVSIPVPESLNGKTITTYYITSTGELEEHETTVENGIATFETDHFSTYILAEKVTSTEEVPSTGDNIKTYVSTLVVSLIGITTLTIYLNKSRFVKNK